VCASSPFSFRFQTGKFEAALAVGACAKIGDGREKSLPSPFKSKLHVPPTKKKTEKTKTV